MEGGGLAFADFAEGPVDGFFEEVAFVGGGLVDERKEFEEGGVGFFFGVYSEGGEQGEGGVAFEFWFAGRPGADAPEGVRGLRRKTFMQTWSQTSQEAKVGIQASMSSGVNSAGSAMRAARI